MPKKIKNKVSKSKAVLFLMRISMGWICLYAGLIKIFDPEWTSAGYLKGATTFSGIFAWLAKPGIINFVDFLNEWGLTLLGISLLLGICVRLSSILGAILMILYYFPVLNFPYVGEHGYILDDHVIYALIMVYLFVTNAGKFWGLDGQLQISWKKK